MGSSSGYHDICCRALRHGSAESSRACVSDLRMSAAAFAAFARFVWGMDGGGFSRHTHTHTPLHVARLAGWCAGKWLAPAEETSVGLFPLSHSVNGARSGVHVCSNVLSAE